MIIIIQHCHVLTHDIYFHNWSEPVRLYPVQSRSTAVYPDGETNFRNYENIPGHENESLFPGYINNYIPVFSLTTDIDFHNSTIASSLLPKVALTISTVIRKLKLLDTLRPRQTYRHFADDILKWIFLNENVWILLNISLKFVPKVQINNVPALDQIMAWCRPGDKPLSEPMMVWLLTHISVTRPQWVNSPYYWKPHPAIRVSNFMLISSAPCWCPMRKMVLKLELWSITKSTAVIRSTAPHRHYQEYNQQIVLSSQESF